MRSNTSGHAGRASALMHSAAIPQHARRARHKRSASVVSPVVPQAREQC
jgi:hypothetical protein